MPGKPIEELKRTLHLKDVCKLASNEIPFYPYYIKSAVIRELKNINRYPLGDCFYLRQVLAKKLKVKEEQLVFGNGSDELIVMALRAFASGYDEIIVGFPTFLIYEMQAKVSSLNVKRVPLRDYRYDLDSIVKAITKKTRIIFIANPDNPHGTYLTHRELEIFFKKIPKNIIVFFDEAYFEFAPKKDFPKSLCFLKKRGNIVITRSFSKAYGLAGLRIGYGITSIEIADVLNKVREPFNVNRVAQVAAVEALKNKNFLKKVLVHTRKEKLFLYRELKRLGILYVESATNFILVNFKRNIKDLYKHLLKRGMIIRDMSSWGLKNFFRVTVGLHNENEAFIKYLKDYLNTKPL